MNAFRTSSSLNYNIPKSVLSSRKYSTNTPTNRLVGLGSQRTQELVLLLDGLEASVTVLGGGIDELQVDGLQVRALGHGHQRLSQGDGSLARASDASLDQQPVLVDHTVVGEATHRGDALLGQIRLGGGRLGVALLTDAQHSLVDLSAVVVTLLTSASHGRLYASRVPGADTGHLSQTSVGLSGQTGDAPTRDDTGISVTASGGADVQGLTLSEDLRDLNRLLEQVAGEVDLGSDISTVDLDLQQVGDLLSQLQLSDLSVGQHTDNLAVLLDAVQLSLVLSRLLGSLLGVLGEGLLLGVVPVLVESALDLIGQVSGPHGGQGAQTVRSGNITNNTNDNHGGSLQDGDGLNSLLLVQLRSWSLDLSNNVGHTSLVADEGSQVRSSSGIVLGEGSDAALVVLGSLLGKILQGAVAGSLVLTVRHFFLDKTK